MTTQNEPAARAALRTARRVVVKAGTSVVTNENGRPSLTRLGAIAEQISELHAKGVEVIFVSSGAVGMGKRLLNKQRKFQMSFNEMANEAEGDNSLAFLLESEVKSTKLASRTSSSTFLNLLETEGQPHTLAEKKKFYDSACAAAGQFEMMNLYSNLFSNCEVTASQVLVTQADFVDPSRLKNLTYSIERLLKLGLVPIINENDAVSGNMGYTADDVFSDNDSLAALCARSFDAEVLLLLTDVEGVYDRHPSSPGATMLDVYMESSEIEIGKKSLHGKLQRFKPTANIRNYFNY